MDREQDDAPVTLSEDAARSGVTGHHVRYVLGFGLASVIIAFAIIGIYFGYDRLAQTVSEALSRDPVAILWSLAPYAAIIGVGVVTAVLLLGLWNLISGPSENVSQWGMRLRVVSQFVIVGSLVAMLYLFMA